MQKRSSYDNKPLHCISGYVCGFEDTAEGGVAVAGRAAEQGGADVHAGCFLNTQNGLKSSLHSFQVASVSLKAT